MTRGAAARVLPPHPVDSPLVEALYLAKAPALVRQHRRRLGADDALDLVHDAFVRLLGLGGERLAMLEQQRPASYLSRIARHLALDRAKADRRRSAPLHVALDDCELVGPDFARQLEARDELRRLEIALGAMRPRTRAIFVAHRVDGLSYAQIAVQCGIGVKGVEKQMGKALTILAGELDRSGNG